MTEAMAGQSVGSAEQVVADFVLLRVCDQTPGQMDVYVLTDEASSGVRLPSGEFTGSADDTEAVFQRVLRELGVAGWQDYTWSYSARMLDASDSTASVLHYALIVPAGGELTGGRWVPVDRLPEGFSEVQLPLLCDALRAAAAQEPGMRVYKGVASERERRQQAALIAGDLQLGADKGVGGEGWQAYIQSGWERHEPLSHWQPLIAEAGRQYCRRYYAR